MRPGPFLGVAFVVLGAAHASAGPDAARQAFAYSLAAASAAEWQCDIPDEVERAQRWIDRFRSNFDALHNREDRWLVSAGLARIEAKLRKIGRHAWCVEYRANRNFSPYAY
jgi:hypothetical protein